MSTLLSPLVFAIRYPAPIILAAVLMIAIGFVWYGPLFGKKWRQLTGVPCTSIVIKPMIIHVISSLVQAAVLGKLLTMTRASSIVIPMSTTMLLWIGFSLSVMAVSNTYARRPVALLAIDAVYTLLTWQAATVLFFMWF